MLCHVSSRDNVSKFVENWPLYCVGQYFIDMWLAGITPLLCWANGDLCAIICCIYKYCPLEFPLPVTHSL